ncbi:MAG: hypothetical protein LBK43_09290 [Treponema sp.]|nr:hypothetical protein [Treponema sp.]
MQCYRVVLILSGVLIFTMPGYAQNTAERGDQAVAEKYVVWAQRALDQGRWAEALVGLERGMDFSDVSSDMAYLLALTRFHEGKPLAGVLEAVQRAIETQRWNSFAPSSAILLEAETFIQLRRYADALDRLARLSPSPDEIYLKLRAFQGLGNREAFNRLMAEALEIYPRNPRMLRIFFSFAQDWRPTEIERDLMTVALRRLPFLLEADQDLAYIAAPFIEDIEEARRMVGAYRGMHRGVASSIVPALNLGLIDGSTAVDELFPVAAEGAAQRLDKALLSGVWKLLRTPAEQEYFRNKVVRFSGLITEDRDNDGYHESEVWYEEGMIRLYTYDGNQDRLPELTVFFESGVPARAEVVRAPEFLGRHDTFGYPLNAQEQDMVTLQWEQYPAVLAAQLEGVHYGLKPFEFFFLPVYLKRLENGVLWYPEQDPFTRNISKQALLSFAAFIERPSREFAGAIERVELEQGIPQRASELLGGRIVSTTEFYRGRPRIQRIDLDANGYLETTRRFRATGDVPVDRVNSFDVWALSSLIEVSESDWDGDGLFEYEEQYEYAADGEGSGFTIERILYFWDIDRDGTREFSDPLSYRSQD